ncbi:MAG TPA: hypothetical protein VN323_09050 [Candidatus Dormibacteraeota bacterium]|nr:hypothetical protein [Candidatus Dormibacteraeota bacterium]
MLALRRRFDFERDAFAFPNELLHEYRFDPATGDTRLARRTPRPHYVLRCFLLAKAARQFLYHARFDLRRGYAELRAARQPLLARGHAQRHRDRAALVSLGRSRRAPGRV